MFKKLILVFAILSGANASPVYYTFKGKITSVNVDDMHISVGDTAEYHFMVDRDLQGYYTDNGNQIFINNPDFYYLEYLGGGPYYTLSTDNVRTSNWACDCSGSVQFEGGVTTPNTWSFLNIRSLTDPEWIVGNEYVGRIYTTGVNSDYREIYSDLILTEVSSPESVPEPSTLAMFLIDLIFVGGVGMSGRKDTQNLG